MITVHLVTARMPSGPQTMPSTATTVDQYHAQFERLIGGDLSSQPEDLLQLRYAAMDRFEQLGFPTTQQEEWRGTSVDSIARTDFQLLDDSDLADQPPETFCLDDELVGSQVVLVNGRFAPHLTALEELPAGVVIQGLADVLAAEPGLVLPHLGRVADFDEQAFVALNTAFLMDGIFIHVPESLHAQRPIHVIHLSAIGEMPGQSHPRTLVVAAANSRLTVVEHYAGNGTGPAFTNAVTEIVSQKSAGVDYVRVQREPENTTHIATIQTHQEADSRVALHTFTTSGGLVRNDVNATLRGPGAEVLMNGLYLVRDHQHVDNHTRIDHVAPHCTSNENYKGILDGHGRAIFNGRIVVHPDAQKTNAVQSNRNLMLSDQALVNTNPQLEIYADDVKCAHGSTVGQIDEETLFYFRTRGIDRDTAQNLLVDGFAREIIRQIAAESVRISVQNLVSDWLTDGHIASGPDRDKLGVSITDHE
ncbi:MAG: Fe-S cluster assembly protein SufD [Fidelibacterota bacterium]|nr:MAG: Fe-S cluster assembly protein SufD [Candidatus Neomarinimicrobiota bacterium]